MKRTTGARASSVACHSQPDDVLTAHFHPLGTLVAASDIGRLGGLAAGGLLADEGLVGAGVLGFDSELAHVFSRPAEVIACYMGQVETPAPVTAELPA